MDAIYGLTMEQLAEMFSKEGELRAQHGEQRGRQEFERYLMTRGTDVNTWALAWNGWHDRFKADPTGRMEAQFHMLLSQLSAKAHFGDVRDMSQDTEEGITLDQYAQITVAVSRAGANADDIVRQHGLQDVAHWQRANAAWSKKMGEDTTHKLTMQYGQLYSKHAGPSFQEETMAQTAAILAAANAPRDVVDEPEEELTPELCLRKMQSPSQKERWRYAGHYAHMADLGNVPDKIAAIATVSPVLLEMIERHDEHTTSDAENGARKLWDLGVRGDDFHGAVVRCLNRAQEKLTSLQAAFAPIQNQAVPERVTLQSRIQDYQSLVETMSEYQREDWGTGISLVSAPSFAPPAVSPQQPMSAHQMSAHQMSSPPIPFPHAVGPRSSGGFPKWILLPVILLGAGAAFYVVKVRPSRSASSATNVTSAAVTAPSAAPKATASATATAHATTPAAAATPAPKAKAGKKAK
jgi:hypothetical protein